MDYTTEKNEENLNMLLSKLGRIIPEVDKLKNVLNQPGDKKNVLTAWKVIKDNIPQIYKIHLYNLLIKPIQKETGVLTDPVMNKQDLAERAEAISFITNLDIKKSRKDRGTSMMMDSLSKGVPSSQIKTRSQRIYTAIDNIILKLAALSQPLSVRPDYDSGQGTTGDVAERLKKIKEQVKKDAIMDAMMIKNIPPMQDYDEMPQPVSPETPCMEDYDEGPQPNAPKIIVIDDYDEDEQPQIVKQGPPCCPECGQGLPAQMGHEAHCLDHKFRAIRDTLRNSDLSESELKVIHGNLDAIYDKYHELEKKSESD